jgi:hypothetical protein
MNKLIGVILGLSFLAGGIGVAAAQEAGQSWVGARKG